MTTRSASHASSGTTGKPKIVGYTREDLDVWSKAVARCLVAAGVGPDDVVQNAYGYGLFTGGLGLHQGVEELGATVIPIGGGNPKTGGTALRPRQRRAGLYPVIRTVPRRNGRGDGI